MSRMTMERAVERAPQSRVDEAVVLGLSDAVQGLAQSLKRMQEEMDTRYHALEGHVNEAVQTMDAVVTGLHQDSANVIVRLQVVCQWLAHHFPEFEGESQALLDDLIAQTQTTAESLFAPATDAVSQEVSQ